MKINYCIPLSIFFILSQCLCAQLKYNQLAAKPVGHNIAQMSKWRYVLKHAPPPPKEEPKPFIDTIFKKDGSIWYIDSAFIEPATIYDGPVEYPDTILLEKNTYNNHGFLILIEEPYGKKTRYSYDKKNRVVQQDLYQNDTVLYYKKITTYNDAKKQVRISYQNQDSSEYMYTIKKYDRKNRLIENSDYENPDTIPYRGHKTIFLNHGLLQVDSFYSFGVVYDYNKMYFNKHGQKVKSIYTSNGYGFTKPSFADSTHTQTTNYYYDTYGNLNCEEESATNSDSLEQESMFFYNQQNNAILQYQINKRKNINTTAQIYYLPQGILNYYELFFQDGSIERYKYDYLFYTPVKQ